MIIIDIDIGVMIAQIRSSASVLRLIVTQIVAHFNVVHVRVKFGNHATSMIG
jgi:hypothetical protein